MKLLRSDKTANVFEIDDISVIDENLLGRLAWPEGVTQTAFRFRRPVVGNPGALLKNISHKHNLRIGYSASREDLVAPVPIERDSLIKLGMPADTEALKALAKSTMMEFFYSPWRDSAPPDFPKQVDSFLEHKISIAGSAWVTKHDLPVSLMNLMEFQDCLGQPVEHIAWAWVDRRLALEDRRQVRACIVDWLKNRRGASFHAFIHSFNFRSLHSIANIGFRPVCVHVSKSG